MTPELVLSRLRRFLMLLSAGLMVGTVIELSLVNHTEDLIQWIPFVLCGVGVVVVGATLLRPQRTALLALRWVMIVLVLGSLLGIYEHVNGNLAFELEIRPGATPSEVFLRALGGAAPLLAPGILALAAVLALAATYYHSALESR